MDGKMKAAARLLIRIEALGLDTRQRSSPEREALWLDTLAYVLHEHHDIGKADGFKAGLAAGRREMGELAARIAAMTIGVQMTNHPESEPCGCGKVIARNILTAIEKENDDCNDAGG